MSLVKQAEALYEPGLPNVSNLANLLALVYHEIEHLNWVGIYYYYPSAQQAYLGPFQGKVACTTIPLQKGVIGQCIREKKKQVVQDVLAHPDHIACDSASRSEIVYPLFNHRQEVVAVLDIDSNQLNRFDDELISNLDQLISYFERAVKR